MRVAPTPSMLLLSVFTFAALVFFNEGTHGGQYETKTEGELKATMEKKTIEELEKSLENLDNSEYGRALMLRTLANAFVNNKEYEKAVGSLEKVLATKSLSHYAEQDILFKLFQLYMKLNQYQKAIDCFERWLPNADIVDPEIHIRVAHAHVVLKQYDEALTPIKKAIELSENVNEEWYHFLISVHAKLNQFDRCISILREMIRLFPSREGFWIQLASIYIKMGDKDKAVAALEGAFKNNVLNDSKNLILLARLLMNNGAPYKAGSLLSELLEQGRIVDTEENLELLSIAWIQSRENRSAVPPLKRLVQMTGKDEYSLWLCQAYIESEQWKQAVDTINDAIKEALVQKKAYEKKYKGREERVVHEHTRPPMLRNMGRLYLYLGIAYYQLSDTANAIVAFSEAVKIAGVSGQANDWLEYLGGRQAAK